MYRISACFETVLSLIHAARVKTEMKANAQTDSRQRGQRTAFVLAVDDNSMHPHSHHPPPPFSVSKRINNQHLK